MIVCVNSTWYLVCYCGFFFQAEDGIRDLVRSRGLGDVYKRQDDTTESMAISSLKSSCNKSFNLYPSLKKTPLIVYLYFVFFIVSHRFFNVV